MLTVLVALVCTQFIVILLLLAYNFKLRQRPEFTVYQELLKRAQKAEKDHEGIQKAFSELRNSNAHGVYMLDAKKAIDADRVTALLATAMEKGEGIAGYETNVQALLMATNPDLEDYPSHMIKIYYGNDAKIALYVGSPTKMPKSLENLVKD